MSETAQISNSGRLCTGMALPIGIFLIALATYVLTGPGRVDMIDGQHRFEVAWNVMEEGRPVVRDAYLGARRGVDGARYSFYGPAASVFAVPLVWLGYFFGGMDGELARFLFSFVSAFFAAATLSLLAHWWLRLGVPPRKALGWTLVVGGATLLWPSATSVFDQAQHAFFVLASAYAGFRSTEDSERKAWSFVSGLAAGILMLYQIPYVIFGPVLALSLLDKEHPTQVKTALPRLVYFFAPWAACGGLWAAYNVARFGSPLDIGAFPGHPLFGNPFIGMLDLVLSPGKGILWFSPVVLLQVWALPKLWRKVRVVALTAGAMTASHFVFIASMSFHGGDWAWGPRYLVTTLPLFSLGLPFLSLSGVSRWAGRGIIVLGVVAQLLGLSLDHQGFFFAHSLRPWFWTDAWSYFRRSQLSYRVTELAAVLSEDTEPITTPFRPGPYPGFLTYSVFGPVPSVSLDDYPLWMKSYPVFRLPRPWPLWMRRLPLESRPAPLGLIVLVCGGIWGLGVVCVHRGLARSCASENGGGG